MKKSSALKGLILIGFSLVFHSAFAQRAYLQINGGYALAANRSNLYQLGMVNSVWNNNRLTEEQLNLSFGQGLNFGLNFGYRLNSYLHADLDFSYLLGASFTANSSNDLSMVERETAMSARMLQLSPSVVFSPATGPVRLFARLGLVFGNASLDVISHNKFSGGSEIEQELLLDGGWAIGMMAGLGLSHKINERFSIVGELRSINMSYAPTRGEVTKYVVDGQDEIATLTTEAREVEFVDSYSVNRNSPPSSDEPSKAFKIRMPFSSLGLNIGLRYNF